MSLRQIADATKLSVSTLDALERGKVGFLPGGIYRRAIVRSYAREVGLDPEEMLREFLVEHPDDLPPPPGAPAPKTVEPTAATPTAGGVKAWRGFSYRAGSWALPLVSTLLKRTFIDR